MTTTPTSLPPLPLTGQSVRLPNITHHWIYLTFPHLPSQRSSRIWIGMNSSNYFTPSRLTNLQLTPPHCKEHPQPHWSAWTKMKSSPICITLISLPLLYAHVIPQILQTQSQHGLGRSFIGSRVVVDFGTTSTLSSRPKMAHSLTVANFRRQLARMPLFPRPHAGNQLIAPCLNILTSSTLTSHLEIVCQLVDSSALSSSWTGQLAKTGVLDSSLSTTMI